MMPNVYGWPTTPPAWVATRGMRPWPESWRRYRCFAVPVWIWSGRRPAATIPSASCWPPKKSADEGASMKSIRLTRVLIFPLLLCALTLACGPRESGPATRKLISKDGHFEITVPGAWKEEKSLNDSADLQASHRPSEMYVVVLSEPNVDL